MLPRTCELSDYQLKTKKSPKHHNKLNKKYAYNNDQQIICDYCGRIFTGAARRAELSSHVDIHRKFSILQCRVCSSNFTTAKILKDHLKRYLSPKVCEFCAASFPRMIELNFHIEAKHTQELKYKCPFSQCSRMFATKKIARDHGTRTHRKKEENFNCRECNKSFQSREDLRVHSFDHYSGEIHTCAEENCRKFFKTNASLKLHLRSHSDEKLYQCLECEKKFVQSSGLRKHMKRCKGADAKKKEETMDPEEIVRIAKEQFEEILRVKGKLTKCAGKIDRKQQKIDDENENYCGAKSDEQLNEYLTDNNEDEIETR